MHPPFNTSQKTIHTKKNITVKKIIHDIIGQSADGKKIKILACKKGTSPTAIQIGVLSRYLFLDLSMKEIKTLSR